MTKVRTIVAKKSYDHIYVARGIGILLVIIGHIIPQESYWGMTIYSFHMPLFIFLSGMFTHTYRDSKFGSYLKKNFVHILLPYLIFMGLGILVNFIVPEWRSELTAANFIQTLLDFNPWYWKTTGALWFLPALFLIKLVFYFYDKFILSKEDKLLTFVSLALLFFAGIYINVFQQWSGITLHFQIKSMMIGLPFYTLGFILSDSIKNFSIDTKSFSKFFVFAITLLLTLRFAARYNGIVNLGGNWYNDSFMFILFSFTGIYSVIFISFLLKKSNLLAFFGKESMNIYLVHLFVQHLFDYYSTAGLGHQVERGFTLQNVIRFLTIVTVSSIYAYAITKTKKQRKAKKGQLKEI